MSKVGGSPILVPPTVSVEIKDKKVFIKGKEGEFAIEIPKQLSIEKTDSQLVIKRCADNKMARSLHGLYRSLINNGIIGVERLWEKRLEVVGTGFNVKLKGRDLVFKLGFSHPIIFKAQPGVSYQVEGSNKIIILGIDKQLVGQLAYQIKKIKKPDPYKGKGIRYEGELLKLKPGKKAKIATAV